MESLEHLDWVDFPRDGFAGQLGAVQYAVDENRVHCTLKVTANHLFNGVCHSGVIVSLADTAMGIGAFVRAGETPCAVIDMNLHFLTSAREGDRLMCCAKVNRFTSGLAFMECVGFAEDKPCLKASGIWKQLTTRRS